MTFRLFTLHIFAFTILCLAAASGSAQATTKSTWAKYAKPFTVDCLHHAQRIMAPDRHASAELQCHLDGDGETVYSVSVMSNGKEGGHVRLPDGAKELLWAPDSKAFLVNGGETAYSGFFATAYILKPHEVRPEIVTDQAQADMVTRFPPCEAANHDAEGCKRNEKQPAYNMSAIGWSKDSDSLLVIAEIPCSSSYGGIMCQIAGYRLSLSDGRILEHLTAAQVKAQWQDIARWRLHVPPRPIYKSQERERRVSAVVPQ